MVVLALPLFLAACGPDPVIKEGKPFPFCSKKSKTYTVQDLIDIAVSEEIRAQELVGSCTKKYASILEFYRANPHCCDIDYNNYAAGGGVITNRRTLNSDFIIGGITMVYRCDAKDRRKDVKYNKGYADITSCGDVTEWHSGSTWDEAGIRFKGRYPKYVQ